MGERNVQLSKTHRNDRSKTERENTMVVRKATPRVKSATKMTKAKTAPPPAPAKRAPRTAPAAKPQQINHHKPHLWKHGAMVDWMVENGYLSEDADAATIVGTAFARRLEWTQSDAYATVVEEHRSEVAETRAASRLGPDGMPRRRGRPPKVRTEAAPSTPPKPRGRPRKVAPAAPVKAQKVARPAKGAPQAPPMKAVRKSKATDAGDNPFA